MFPYKFLIYLIIINQEIFVLLIRKKLALRLSIRFVFKKKPA